MFGYDLEVFVHLRGESDLDSEQVHQVQEHRVMEHMGELSRDMAAWERRKDKSLVGDGVVDESGVIREHPSLLLADGEVVEGEEDPAVGTPGLDLDFWVPPTNERD